MQDVQQSKGVSSNLKLYGQKRATGYDDYDSDHAEVISLRGDPSNSLSTAPYAVGAKKSHPFSAARLPRPTSPSKIHSDRVLGSGVEEFSIDNSPGRFVERGSPSPITDYSSSRAIERDNEVSEWRQYPDGKRGRFEPSNTHDLSNMYERQRTRALIHAYGSDRGQRSPNGSLQIEHLDTVGIGNKIMPLSWQNTEEEEFDWEKMGPTIPVRGSSKVLSGPVPRGVGPRPNFGVLTGAPSVPNSRNFGSSHSRIAMREDSSIVVEDSMSSLDVCFSTPS